MDKHSSPSLPDLLVKFTVIIHDLKLFLFPKLKIVIATTDEREYWDTALDSVGKYLGVDRWCIQLEVVKGKKVMRLGTNNNWSVLSFKHSIIVAVE